MTSTNVPEAVVVDILTRLPVKSLRRFRGVCKEWCSLLDSEYFIKKHLECSRKKKANCILVHKRINVCSFVSAETLETVSPDVTVPLTTTGVKLSGPVNGIVRLSYENDNGACDVLCNLSTREFRELPRGVRLCDRVVADGFGFDEKSSDYKLVRIIYYANWSGGFHIFDNDEDRFSKKNDKDGMDDNSSGLKVEIYSLSSNCWRELDNLTFSDVEICRSPHGYLNGAYHWFVFHVRERRQAIMYFRMDIEVFQEMITPNVCYARDRKIPTIFVSDTQNLSLILNDMHEADRTYEVWTMKEYGVEESWTKQYTIGPIGPIGPLSMPDLCSPRFPPPIPVSIGGNNNELLLCGPRHEIVLCHLHDTGKVKVFKVNEWGYERPINLAFYAESLVSIKQASHAA